MTYSSHDLANLLERLDDIDIDSSEEGISASLVRVCLQRVPGLSWALLGINCDSWGSGGNHNGDIVGRDLDSESSGIKVHIEIKGRYTNPNRSKTSCFRDNCQGGNRLQVEHMLEDDVPVFLLCTPRASARSWLKRHEPALLAQMRGLSWRQVADAMRAVDPVVFDPIAAILGVEARTPGDG